MPTPTNNPTPGDSKPTLAERIRGWRLGLSIDGEPIVKGVVCGILLVFFSLVQTTVLTRFKPFGAIPDLILPLVVAVSITEREKWGAVFGLIAAFIIESLGGSTFTILPLLYMPVGYVCGILITHYLSDTIATRALFTLATTFIRVIFTLISIYATVANVTLPQAMTQAVVPEFLACLSFAWMPHVITKLSLHRFNKSRDERIH